MIYTALILFSLFVASVPALGQTYQFASHGGGTNKDEFLDFAVDNAGNSYVLLKYEGNVTFGGNGFTNASKNTVLVKYNPDGGLAMTKDIVAEWPNFMFGAVGVSSDGVVVVAARTKAGLLDGKPVYSGNFIAKLGSEGEFEWVIQPVDRIDGASQFTEFRVTAIAVTQGHIYAAATTDGRVTLNGFTDPGFSINDRQSALLIRMDLAGNVDWIQRIPTPEVDNHPTIDGGMDHILPSADGAHIYVAGKVGDGSYNPYEVAYVAKFRTDGTFLWVKKTSSSGADSWGIAEASNGDLITGFGVGGPQVIDFGAGARLEESEKGWLGALARFDQDGNVKMLTYVADALLAESSGIAANNYVRLYHLAVDQNDQVVLLGKLVGSHTFKNDIHISSTPGVFGNSEDVAIIVCELDFNPLEAHANTGSNNEVGHKGVIVNGRLYFSGEYDSYSHPFFGAFGPEFGEVSFMSAGDQDIFVASLDLPILEPEAPLGGVTLGYHATIEDNELTLSWSAEYSDAVVNFSPDLTPGSWSDQDVTPNLDNGQWNVTLPLGDGSGFYRLWIPE